MRSSWSTRAPARSRPPAEPCASARVNRSATRSPPRARASCARCASAGDRTSGCASQRPASRWRSASASAWHSRRRPPACRRLRHRRSGGGRVLLDELAGAYGRVPLGQQRHLVVPVGLGARLRDLLREPVALPGLLVGEGRDLEEVGAVVLRAHQRPVRGAVVERGSRCGLPRLLELVRAERNRVPAQRHDDVASPHAPTSARIAPGPSSVLPSPSAPAPTRTEILPRCLLSRMSWCASPTPSKPIVRHRTGRIWPLSINSLAL